MSVARTALWARDSERAARALARLRATGLHGPAGEANLATISAGLAALSGRPDEARSTYRTRASELARPGGCAFDEALTAIDMATLLGPAVPEARAAADSAREILTRLGGKPFLERLEEAIQRQPSAAHPTPARSRDRSSV